MDSRDDHASEVSKTDLENLADIRYALRRFLRFSELAARDAGFSSQQYLTLLAIQGFHDRDWATVGEIAERLQLKHHSAVGLVNRLEAQRLIVREQDTVDQRQVRVRATELGIERLKLVAGAHTRHWRTIGPDLLGIISRILDESQGFIEAASPSDAVDVVELTEASDDDETISTQDSDPQPPKSLAVSYLRTVI